MRQHGFLHIPSDLHRHLKVLQISLLRHDEHLDGGDMTLQLLEISAHCQHFSLKHEDHLLHLVEHNEGATGPAVHTSHLWPLARHFLIFLDVVLIVLIVLGLWDDFQPWLHLLRAWLDGREFCKQVSSGRIWIIHHIPHPFPFTSMDSFSKALGTAFLHNLSQCWCICPQTR